MWKRSRKDGCNLEKVKSDEVLFLKLWLRSMNAVKYLSDLSIQQYSYPYIQLKVHKYFFIYSSENSIHIKNSSVPMNKVHLLNGCVS